MTRAGAAGALAVAVLLAAPAFACTTKTTFSTSPSSAPPGGTTNVMGIDFDAEGMPVKVQLLDVESETGPVLASFQPDAQGRFSGPVTVPSDAKPGYYDLVATQTRSSGQQIKGIAQQRFKVLSPGEQPPSEPAPQRQPASSEQPAQSQPEPQPSAANQPAAASPAPEQRSSAPAAPAPSRGTAAPAPAASRPAPPAPAVDAAQPAPAPAAIASQPAPAVAEEQAPPAAETAAPVVQEAPAVPEAAGSSDMWRGFSDGEAAGLSEPATAPARSDGSASATVALLSVGLVALLAGATTVALRRRRAHAGPDSAEV